MESVGVVGTPEAAEGQGRGHGKVILLGEHSVVYGRPAISAGLDRGCSARAVVGPADTLSVEPWGVRVAAAQNEEDPEREQLRRGFALLCERLDDGWRALGRSGPRPRLGVSAAMEIPGGAGLGGSAALSVAVVRAMEAAVGLAEEAEAIMEASLAWERVFHGNPSGVDSAMAVHGGLALYVRGQPLTRLPSARALQLVVGNSAEHGSTKATVASVARQHQQEPAKLERIFDDIAELVGHARAALSAGDHARLGQLMDLNHTWLCTLQLSTPRLDDMCRLSRVAGALGAKLTGGGGGGCMIALGRDAVSSQRIVRALADAGYEAFAVEVSA